MKLFRHLLFIIGLLPSIGVSAQVCSGNYTWNVNGNAVSFLGTTSPGITSIIWSFGDGNFDYTNTISPTHTYANAGTYQACIIVYDSSQSCSDSACHMVVIDSCYGSFTYLLNGLTGNFYGYANGGSANTVYQWNFGDNTTSTQQNPSHVYANAGTYMVCFAYYDLTTGCADSVCMPITISVCVADFSIIDSLGYVFFINTSSLGNGGNYLWDFGDGNFSSQQNPSNTYSNPGTYQVCLTALDSNQIFCDSTCHFITITNVAGVFENSNSIAAITVSPNPSDENVYVSFLMQASSEVEIVIYDIAGRALINFGKEQYAKGKQGKQINTQEILPGTYFVQLKSNGQVSTCKMIVTHR